MRITNNMLTNMTMNSLYKTLSDMSKVQNQLATGKKINRPSDDPMIASRALKYRSDISEIEQYIKNTDDAISWAEITDDTLGSIGDVLQRARELAVQAANGTNSSTETNNIKQEVMQLFEQLTKLGNKSYAGRYIFSGFKTDKSLISEEDSSTTYTDVPIVTDGTDFRLRHQNITAMTNIMGEIGGVPTAFTIVGGPPAASGEVQADTTTGQLAFFAGDIATGLTNMTASYTVDRQAGDYNPDTYSFTRITQTVPMEDENIQYSVGISDKVNINVLGTKVFGAVSGTDNVGLNMKNFMEFVDSLATNDTTGIKQAITDIDTFINSVLEQRADIGARTNRIELTKNRLSSELTNFTDLKSKNEDADMAEVIMNLKNKENVYQASLEAGARVIQPSLVDFLG